MKRNSRLALALHTLGHMAADPAQMQTSTQIAEHAGTNPVVVRRVLGKLRQAGLLVSEKGHAGGWRLARPPEEITLADIYLALEENLVSSEPEDDTPRCAVEDAVQRKVTSVLQDIEQSLVTQLRATSLADVQETSEQHVDCHHG
ncbi:transcriptional regulator [Jannaschia pagri]|uniref:Transcriptional regulator n=1 Tax=Jannaschia pagri TaxID=2829797 RepID=A0ABQ4NJ85_9RHOB|nr:MULTISPECIES: Rrf2 family transcriptional regulator [unclassified Jannaschia]GIT90642.1 transcriptional regulator [Jannaschia sp. AI_61]GIT94474.1 transcriptional regulator [Jannaschia sp. AI_62]